MTKKAYDVHLEVPLGDYWLVEADSPEEARELMLAMILDHTERIIEGLRDGLTFVEPQDIKVTDILER